MAEEKNEAAVADEGGGAQVDDLDSLLSEFGETTEPGKEQSKVSASDLRDVVAKPALTRR